MRILVCGGRDFTDGKLLSETLYALDAERPITTIIHGGARGADYLAHVWATMGGYDEEAYPADWVKHGLKAGFIRNTKMLKEGKPDLVVAFPGGRGTSNMMEQAEKAGIEVMVVE